MVAKKPRKPNWDDPSMQVLCDGVERRIATIKGRFSPSLTQEKKQAAWASVTACVNAVTFGCTRTIDEVKKRWQDAQSAVKKKESTRLKKAAGTGGGPAPQIYFKCWERIVLRTMSPTSISGLEGGVDTAESQILESSMLSVSEHDTCPPHENDNDVCEIANGDSCVPVVAHIENETATCSVSCQGETTPAEDQSETIHNKGARRKKRTGHIEIATSSVSCQGDTTSAEDATERTHRVGPKRKADLDLPSELLNLKRKKIKQEEDYQKARLEIEQRKAKTLNEIKDILVSLRDTMKTSQSQMTLSPYLSPIIKFD